MRGKPAPPTGGLRSQRRMQQYAAAVAVCPTPGARLNQRRLHIKLASDLAVALRVPEAWQVEVAARLGEIGAVTLPGRALDALACGSCTDPAVRAMLDRLPSLADDVLGRIPRLDAVRDIVREQEAIDHHDGPRPRRSLPAEPADGADTAA